MVRARQPRPERKDAGYNSRLTVDLVIPSSGNATYKIITAFTDENDYKWIKLEYNGSNGRLVPTFYGSAGTSNVVMDTTLYPGGEIWTPSPGTNFTMEFCNADVEWSLSAEEVRWQTCGGGLESLSTLSVGAVGFIEGEFDNFSYSIHWESDLDCEKCHCFCVEDSDDDVYKCIPETLSLRIEQDSPGTFDCSCVDDLELTLYQCYDPDTSGATPTFPKWPRKSLWFSDPFECEEETIWFIFQCPSQSSSATLSVVTYPSKTTTGSAYYIAFPQSQQPNDATESTCVPFSMVFKNLTPSITTCDLPGGGTGTKAAVCAVCHNTTPTPVPTWTVYVTE